MGAGASGEQPRQGSDAEGQAPPTSSGIPPVSRPQGPPGAVENTGSRLKEKGNRGTAVAASAAAMQTDHLTQQQAQELSPAAPPASGGSGATTNNSSTQGGQHSATTGGGHPQSSLGRDGKKREKLLNGTSLACRYLSGSNVVDGFKDGKLYGFGKYHNHLSNDEYEGEWFAGLRHGKGVCGYGSGNLYSGEWRADKKHGKGTYLHITGDEYIGLFENDLSHGYGVLVTARNGNRYEGSWKESYRHGKRKLISGTGDVYDGKWVKGKKEGLGVLTYVNGSLYAGDWKAGQMDGKGIMHEKTRAHCWLPDCQSACGERPAGRPRLERCEPSLLECHHDGH